MFSHLGLSNHEVEHLVAWWHQVQSLHHSQELLLGDVLRLRSVEVHEAWLEQDSVRHHMAVKSSHAVNHGLLFVVREFLHIE